MGCSFFTDRNDLFNLSKPPKILINFKIHDQQESYRRRSGHSCHLPPHQHRSHQKNDIQGPSSQI